MIVGGIAGSAHHEIQGATQTGQDGNECKRNEDFHDCNYPVTSRARFFIATVAAIVGVLVTVLLGQWQLGRGNMRERMHASIEEKGRLPAISIPVLEKLQAGGTADSLNPLLFRQVQLRGRWMPENTVFLDNRQMLGKPGFFVLTPLQIEGSSMVVMIQRGWVARNFMDRNQLPSIPTPAGMVEVTGRLEGPPARLLELGPKQDPTGGPPTAQGVNTLSNPMIRQNLSLEAFAKETKIALLHLMVVQTTPSSIAGGEPYLDGLLRDWPLVNSGASKNFGYAAQWFALSVLIAGLYIWFQFGKAYVAKKR